MKMTIMFNKASAPRNIQVSSCVRAAPVDVLDRVSRIEGVNQELWPFMRMTMPREHAGRSLFEAPLGEHLFRSVMILFGLLPVDYDDIMLVSMDPSSGFVESSTMLSMRTWRHERRVTTSGSGGSRIADTLTFTPRVPGTGPLLETIVSALFHHRHRRLARLFG